MKYDGRDDMLPWRDRVPVGASEEDRASKLIAGALSPVEPDARKLAHIERRLFSPEQRRQPSRLLLRAAVVAAVMVACVATVKAYEMARRSGWLGIGSPSATQAPPRATPPRAAVKPHAPAPFGADAVVEPQSGAAATVPERTTTPAAFPPMGEPPLPAETSPTATDGSRTPSRTSTVSSRTRRSPVARRLASTQPVHGGAPLEAERTLSPQASPLDPPASPTARPEMPSPRALATVPATRAALPPPVAPAPPVQPMPSASDEVRALDRAVTLLRRDHDGLGALAALDAYLASYPRGLFSHEARFARVDALLLLGRSDQALADLELLPLDHGRRSTELKVIRAELKARSSCASAEADFSAALSQGPDTRLLERILYGRGVCRSKLGNLAGAVDDLRRYVERFPDGAHAASARTWLESTASGPSKERR